MEATEWKREVKQVDKPHHSNSAASGQEDNEDRGLWRIDFSINPPSSIHYLLSSIDNPLSSLMRGAT
jgi:hypothetical protein